MTQTKRCSVCDAILSEEADSAGACVECVQRDVETEMRPLRSTVAASVAQILQEEAAREAVLGTNLNTTHEDFFDDTKKFQIGFRIGFYSIIFIGLLSFAMYIFSVELSEFLPKAAPVLVEYTAGIDTFFDVLADFFVPPILDVIWAWEVILEKIETMRLWTTGLGSSSRA